MPKLGFRKYTSSTLKKRAKQRTSRRKVKNASTPSLTETLSDNNPFNPVLLSNIYKRTNSMKEGLEGKNPKTVVLINNTGL